MVPPPPTLQELEVAMPTFHSSLLDVPESAARTTIHHSQAGVSLTRAEAFLVCVCTRGERERERERTASRLFCGGIRDDPVDLNALLSPSSSLLLLLFALFISLLRAPPASPLSIQPRLMYGREMQPHMQGREKRERGRSMQEWGREDLIRALSFRRRRH